MEAHVQKFTRDKKKKKKFTRDVLKGPVKLFM